LRLKLASIEEWIKLVDQEKGVDPNEQVGLLAPLEEAILSESLETVDILIKKGTDINRSVCNEKITVVKDVNRKPVHEDAKERYGCTLLHVAVLSPNEMQDLWKSHAETLGVSRVVPRQCCASVEIVDLLLKHISHHKIHEMEKCRVEATPLNWARSNYKKISNGVIQEKYKAIVELLEKLAPPQSCAQRIPPGHKPSSLCPHRHTKK
jgi:hypothetical protein